MAAPVKISAVREVAKRVFGESAAVHETAVSYLRHPAVVVKVQGRHTVEFTGSTGGKARAFAVEILSQLPEAKP
jgi:hypothetical protein